MTTDSATITTSLHLRVSPEQAARYADAAKHRGMQLGKWIEASLDDASASDYNRLLKLISSALELRHDDIVSACKHGGHDASRSAVRAWLAGHGSTKIGAHGQTLHRYRQMPRAAFEAFAVGLKPMLAEIEMQND